MIQRFFITFVFIVCHVAMQGADTLSVSRRAHLWHSDKPAIIRLAQNQPALKQFLPLDRYTEISVNTTIQNNNSLHYHHQGDTHHTLGGEVVGYHKNDRNTLFGKAAYHRQKEKYIRWSQVEDVHRLGPYIIADSTTGTRDYETYLLSGGLSHQTPAGTLGLSASYRAQSSYRTRDPRSYSIISDFKFTAGWALPVGRSNLAALSVTFGRYDQALNIKSYEEGRTDLIYFMYGFGYYNQNLSGSSDNYSTDYKGNNHALEFQFLPIQEEGWFLNTRYASETIDAAYSHRTRGSYKSTDLILTSGYQWKTPAHQYRISLDATHETGQGTEFYYETFIVDTITATTETQLLSKNQKFHKQYSSLSLTGKGWITNNQWTIIPELKSGILFHSSEYRTTPWKTAINQLIIKPSMGIRKNHQQSISTIDIATAWITATSNKLQVAEDNLIVQKTLLPDFQFRSANKFYTQLEAKHIQTMKNQNAWQIKAGCKLLKARGETATKVWLSLGLVLF
ncbi:DUF6850 family outer membrane beta-barrel protein [Marinilabilia salmonicolor]|uniref:DUF6850 domain-containing protein n=1 Tax=Marinilabilia salmonicolor TaxID=989 RepID=A0A368UP73_9BACT|nr:DUF6850 family outer membrane beta-barrel protein [Marinilabilia salmonicolor]RCW29194.1 hypothetical protein DFO77_13012 [Marinilabilia salmonicolor]